MVEDDGPARKEIVARVGDAARCGSPDDGTQWCGDIHAGMRAPWFAVEKAAEPKRGRAPAGHRRQHAQRRGRRARESNQHAGKMRLLELVAREVLGREINLLLRHLEMLRRVFLVGHFDLELRIRNFEPKSRSRYCIEGDADQRDPLASFAPHQHPAAIHQRDRRALVFAQDDFRDTARHRRDARGVGGEKRKRREKRDGQRQEPPAARRHSAPVRGRHSPSRGARAPQVRSR
jgi:hypothetical protein